MYQTYRILRGLVDVILFIVELFLGLRLLLRFFGANAQADFVQWVYETSRPLIEPFIPMFPSPVIDGQFVLEFNTLFAMIIYALVGYLIQELLWHVPRISRHEPTER